MPNLFGGFCLFVETSCWFFICFVEFSNFFWFFKLFWLLFLFFVEYVHFSNCCLWFLPPRDSRRFIFQTLSYLFIPLGAPGASFLKLFLVCSSPWGSRRFIFQLFSYCFTSLGLQEAHFSNYDHIGYFFFPPGAPGGSFFELLLACFFLLGLPGGSFF